MSSVVVLCYHAVSADWPAQMAVTPERFEQQLRLLVGRGYRGATFTEAVLAPPHRKTLAVTFDDGVRSVLDRAAPVLDELGLPATVFVPTELVGSAEPMSWPGVERWVGGPHERELVPLGWDELRGLRERGWEIGSHTRSHARLITLEDAALTEELEGSRARLEAELGAPCRSLAYPFGEANAHVVEAGAAAGYEAACGLPSSFGAHSALAWPRTGVWRSDGPVSFRLKVAAPVQALQSSRAFHALDRPRRGLKRLLRPGRIVRGWAD
ncbi:MAG TPA: polysaccharide deacetylase family protein [Gaiellaceae bacterium]